MILLKGSAVSRGVAIGKVYVYRAFTYEVHEAYFEEGFEGESFAHFTDAVKDAEAELDALIASFGEQDEDKTQIFEAHKQILTDEDIFERVKEEIYTDHTVTEYAVQRVFDEYIALMRKVNDPLISERVDDLRDVRNRLLRIIGGGKEENLAKLPREVIVVARDLLPSVIATMDRTKVKGIITEKGGANSHTAIIARGYGIPAVLDVKDATKILKSGAKVIIDAANNNTTGVIRLDPDKETIKRYKEKEKRFAKEQSETRSFLDKEARLKSGERIQIGINIDTEEYIEAVNYSDFVGILRTENIFSGFDNPPSEEEQLKSYKNALVHANGKTVTIRTFDFNPSGIYRFISGKDRAKNQLGVRGIRYSVLNQSLFTTQLRAAYRASAFGKIRILFPMVSCVEDLLFARELCESVRSELTEQRVKFDSTVPLGIVIEIPQAAVAADLLAPLCDFACVGTNDLCQYFSAASRGETATAPWHQSYAPAFLRLVKSANETFKRFNTPLYVCGELAAEQMGAVILVGLGYEALSIDETCVARIKRILSEMTRAEAETVANKALSMTTEQEVLEYVRDVFGEYRKKTEKL